jgi:hypothetical protein
MRRVERHAVATVDMLEKVMKIPSGDQAWRRTFIVDTALAAREARTRAAQNHHHGCQVMSVDQAAARLAGGFLQPVPREHLQDAMCVGSGLRGTRKPLYQQAATRIGPLFPARIDSLRGSSHVTLPVRIM